MGGMKNRTLPISVSVRAGALGAVASLALAAAAAEPDFTDVFPPSVKVAPSLKRDFAARAGCPVYDGYAYGHIPVSHAIDFRREVSVSEDGTMTWSGK